MNLQIRDQVNLMNVNLLTEVKTGVSHKLDVIEQLLTFLVWLRHRFGQKHLAF